MDPFLTFRWLFAALHAPCDVLYLVPMVKPC